MLRNNEIYVTFVTWASGLVVMTSRLQRGDRRFNSGLAHFPSIFIYFLQNIIYSFSYY
jgi:hypothetical protein